MTILGQSFASPAPTLRFSISAAPIDRRASAMADFLVELMRTEVHLPDEDTPFRYEAQLRVVEGASWGSARSSAIVTRRTRQLLKDDQDHVMLVMPGAKMVLQSPGKDDLVIAAGEAMLLSHQRESQIIVPSFQHNWALRVPHRDLAALVPGLGAAPLTVLRQNTPMLSLLRRYGQLLDAEPLADPMEQAFVARQLLQMLALAVGTAPDLARHIEQEAVAPARLAAIEADIVGNLGNTNLNLNWVAARHGLSPRHLQRLLAQRGTSFSDFVGSSRLGKARQMLEDPRLASRSVVSIALECGFPEASSLNRSFRRAYGMTPTDARVAALSLRHK